ncbi:MAG: DUF4136 domain-containing protein [Chitinophagaceae bacterium]|nr:MAG: DUF4136 domain-containing protein [Chitinophagaceae bacterium]
MKNTLKASVAGLFISSFFLLSCASTAHIEKDENINFSEYKTYAWENRADVKKDNSNQLVEDQVKMAVDEQLQKNTGWKLVKNNPDLVLSYDLMVDKSVSQRSDPVYSNPQVRSYYNPYTRRVVNIYYPSRFLGYDNYDIPVNEGTVSISMVDTKTDKTVWQGWTTDNIDSRKFKSGEAKTAVKSIFRKFDLAKN